MTPCSPPIFPLFVAVILLLKTPIPLNAQSQTLIDFSKYQKIIQNPKLYHPNDSPLRKQFYENPKSVPNPQYIQFQNHSIPPFKIAPNDMNLDQWIIRYVHPQFKLQKRAKIQSIHQQQSLKIPLHFPRSYQNLEVHVKPPFLLYPYDSTGQFAPKEYGIVHNVQDIHQIQMILGFQTQKLPNVSLSLKLQNSQNQTLLFPMGFLFSKINSKPLYFSHYDGKSFSKPLSFQQLPQNPQYYRVFFQNQQIPLWTMLVNQQPVYHQISLTWNSSQYIPPTRRSISPIKKKLYPQKIPYLQFDRLIIKNHQNLPPSHLDLFLKKIILNYELANPYYFNTIDDDKHWNILKSSRISQRKKLESRNAWKIFNILKRGQKNGILFYQDFLKLTQSP